MEEVYVEDGTVVRAGQPLFRLSNADLQLGILARESESIQQINNINSIKLQIEQSRNEHEKTLAEAEWQVGRLSRQSIQSNKLVANGFMSKESADATNEDLAYWERRKSAIQKAKLLDETSQEIQFKQLTTSAAQLQKNLEIVRRNLDALTVRAPRSGVVTALSAVVGQYFARGAHIAQLDDVSNFKIVATVDEFYLSRVVSGLSGLVTIGPRDFELTVTKVYPQVKNSEFVIDMAFKKEMPTDLRRGQAIQAKLTFGAIGQALTVPNGPFIQETGGAWVFVVRPDNVAEKRKIKVGRRNERQIEILEGIKSGENVITSNYTQFRGFDKLKLVQ